MVEIEELELEENPGEELTLEINPGEDDDDDNLLELEENPGEEPETDISMLVLEDNQPGPDGDAEDEYEQEWEIPFATEDLRHRLWRPSSMCEFLQGRRAAGPRA